MRVLSSPHDRVLSIVVEPASVSGLSSSASSGAGTPTMLRFPRARGPPFKLSVLYQDGNVFAESQIPSSQKPISALPLPLHNATAKMLKRSTRRAQQAC